MINYDYITGYIRNTIKKSTGILKEMEDYAREHHVPIVQSEVAALLTVLGSLLRPSRILEIGTAIGYSSILLSGSLGQDGIIDTIERNEPAADKAVENVKRAGLQDKIRVIRGDASEVLACLEGKYDMIFLDAAKGQYPEFLPECMRLLEKGGLLISDNVLYKGMVANDGLVVRRKKTIVGRMREYLNTICSTEELDTSIVPIGDGVAISYRRTI